MAGSFGRGLAGVLSGTEVAAVEGWKSCGHLLHARGLAPPPCIAAGCGFGVQTVAGWGWGGGGDVGA